MFYSVVIPGILPAGPVRETGVGTLSGGQVTRRRESVLASMTAEKSTDASSSDDGDTLSLLYEQFRRPIHSYIYRLLGSMEDADDVTQEVFVRACIAWDGLYERNNLSAWLYRIATNLCVDHRRTRAYSPRAIKYAGGICYCTCPERCPGSPVPGNSSHRWHITQRGRNPYFARQKDVC